MGLDKTQQDGPATEALPALDFTLARAGKKYVDLIKQGKINSAPVYGDEKLLDLMHLGKGGLGGFNSRCFWFMGSDLHKLIGLAWGKADGMVPDKYKRARLFAFEAPDVLGHRQHRNRRSRVGLVCRPQGGLGWASLLLAPSRLDGELVESA